MECPFTKEVWSLVLQPLSSLIIWPHKLNHLFNKWKSTYRGSLKNKQAFKASLLALPKFVTWKIWLARNQAIFSNNLSPPGGGSFKEFGFVGGTF
jgi:hypothetical protein